MIRMIVSAALTTPTEELNGSRLGGRDDKMVKCSIEKSIFLKIVPSTTEGSLESSRLEWRDL